MNAPSELLPTVQAANVQASITDFLTTTFALSDPDVRTSLDGFLSHPGTGMFKGPYVRTRLPFEPAAEGWERSLEWQPPQRPYGHQAAAYARLVSQVDGPDGPQDRRPLPTLVVSGTGSGKTEAFLHPILDHVQRARRRGVTGLKALLLYPMNALANDQAGRLTRLITGDPQLRGVTAGIYTGEQTSKRSLVSTRGLINDREVMRDTPPDILLTNYKMLDQLLLRAADATIWQRSALSLQYLVLDEFHTYDGAQGTDVAMLLRRLGLVLKGHWPADAEVTAEDRERPLGIVTPVATSATLGDKRDPAAMQAFAQDVFGEAVGEDAVITETRLPLAEWVGGATAGATPVPTGQLDVAALRAGVDELGHDPHGAELAAVVLAHLYGTTVAAISRATPHDLLDLARSHPLVQAVAEESRDAVALADLAAATRPETTTADAEVWQAVVADVVAMLGHVRSVVGREALSVEVHLWVRELTRVDRAAQALPEFRWGDDGPVTGLSSLEAVRPSWPAVYCRHCGRSGWMVAMSPTGNSLQTSDESIRADHAAGKGRTLALLHAPREATEAAVSGETVVGLRWFAVRTRDLHADAPGDDDPDALDGWTLPVLTVLGQQGPAAATKDTCPSCAQEDGIRFLGSAVATLLSVSLSTLFGSGAVDGREKKALVFTDSVQDAAHRAGFVQARSHTLTFRAAVYDAVRAGEVTLDELPERMLTLAGDDAFARYRLLHPDLADDPRWSEFWRSRSARSAPAQLRRRVRARVACDVALEAGLSSRVGRTLELTGAVAIGVDAGPPSRLTATARSVLVGFSVQGDLHADGGLARRATTDNGALLAWVRGVLERMRTRGAVEHEWFTTYRKRDGRRYPIWGGRRKDEGAPAFPSGRQAPAYPRVGGSAAPKDSGLDPVTSPQSWYSLWAARVLGVTPADGGSLTRLLLARLVELGVLRDLTSETAATVYSLPTTAVVLSPTTESDLAAGRHLLVCDVCQTHQPGTLTTVDQLEGRPCSSSRCSGRMRREAVGTSFYRRLYASPDMRRVVAREHTSLLRTQDRVEYESAFASADPVPSDPNVLVATPTLEMGIDIGDLSTVFLSSLPRTVASYLQRVGRAGRLTGNALDLAYVTGRGDQLPRLGDPLSVINGTVRPPATYLNAEEILRRQLTAHLADGLASASVTGGLTGTTATPLPTSAHQVMSSVEPGSYLGDLVDTAEAAPAEHARRFCATFATAAAPPPGDVVAALETWLTPGALPRTSPFAAHVTGASGRWVRSVAELRHRADTIEERLPDIEAKAAHPAATDDDQTALRSARTALKVTFKQLGELRGEHWVAVLEEHGVFPNYTLLDDGVTLDVGVTWVNPDTDTFESTPHAFRRGAGQAIRELAPGATFYASGLEIPVDAVDLGVGGEGVRPWVHCPACGYAVDAEATGVAVVPSACPRCGSTGIADAGQRLAVLELRKVTAEVRRDDASIGDRSDERDRKRFQVLVSADVDPAAVADRWYVDGIGLGCTLLRSVDIRWTNLGPPGRGGAHTIAGQQAQAGLFRVCEGCGKLDSDAGANKPHEHRPWCRYRTAPAEHTVTVALSRTLTTQGLLLRLPKRVTIGDQFAVPSVAAALLLGLQEEIGGHPEHLAVQHVVEPDAGDGGGTHEALLLHDVVPGGTGYLTDLADPEHLRRLLVTAFRRVCECECQAEPRLACHRCLLPFALSGQVRSVSRAAAERHLRTLLGLADDAEGTTTGAWTVVTTPPEDALTGDSVLEQRFYALVRQRLGPEGLGMAVQEVPGPRGNSMHFTGGTGRRTWTLAPQVPLRGCMPDFVLSCSDANVPETAVFVDGREFHASAPRAGVMADDAGKRETLRLTGRSVVAVTSRDLDAAENGTAAAPSWFSTTSVARALQVPALQAPPESYARLGTGVLDQLVAWVQAPSGEDQGRVARSVPLFLITEAAPSAQPTGASLETVAAATLTGEAVPDDGGDTRTVFVWREGAVAAAITVLPGNVMAVALVLDDRPSAVDAEHADAWRRWLGISNALAQRDWPTSITTVTRVAAGPQGVPPDRPEAAAEVPAAWRAALDAAQPGAERKLLLDLSAVPRLPVPEIGVEGPDGIPLDLAFAEQKVAVLVEATADDVRDLEAAGWAVVGPDAGAVVAAVLGER